MAPAKALASLALSRNKSGGRRNPSFVVYAGQLRVSILENWVFNLILHKLLLGLSLIL